MRTQDPRALSSLRLLGRNSLPSSTSLGASAPHVRPPQAVVPPTHTRVATRTPTTQMPLPSTHVEASGTRTRGQAGVSRSSYRLSKREKCLRQQGLVELHVTRENGSGRAQTPFPPVPKRRGQRRPGEPQTTKETQAERKARARTRARPPGRAQAAAGRWAVQGGCLVALKNKVPPSTVGGGNTAQQ